MLETMIPSTTTRTTFVKCGVVPSSASEAQDPLRWDCQQFPADSNSSTFSPIKQEVMDTYEGGTTTQSDFTELKAMQPFDYGGASLTGVDPCLSNNNNDSNNNSKEKSSGQSLNIYIKPLSPPTPSSRESFCFNASPSDVTSSGSISPPGNVIKLQGIDFPPAQDAFDDIANIVGISCGMGADSTVPGTDTLEHLDLDDWIERTANIVKPLGNPTEMESILPTSSGSENSITNVSMSNTQPYLNPIPNSTLAGLLSGLKGPIPRGTILDQRDPFPNIVTSPILHKQLTGYVGDRLHWAGGTQIKVENTYEAMVKHEYPSYDQLPHSTMGDPRHRLSDIAIASRNKQKPPKPRPRLLGSGGEQRSGGAGGGGGPGCQGDQGKKMMHHCQICNRGFLNKSNIKVHLRTHTGEKPFGCEHCSKAFRQKAHLLKHMSIHKRISRD